MWSSSSTTTWSTLQMQPVTSGRNQCCVACDLHNEPCDRNSTGTTQHSKRLDFFLQLGDNGKMVLDSLSEYVPQVVEDIQWQGWRHHILMVFLPALALSSESSTRKAELGKIKKMRTWYMQRELLIPLQLAIWKSQCLQDMPPERECYLSWATTGWKANKVTQWESNARATIVSLVEPLLLSQE
jgi:hypothetical protein